MGQKTVPIQRISYQAVVKGFANSDDMPSVYHRYIRQLDN